ncbi:MAG: DUF401 family protein, partial [Chloroflexi bacterium]|nr:DUF401 family protein [Chloroflexota bacterium]
EKATRSIAADLLRAAWPVLLLVLLVSLGVDAVIAFPVALGLCALQQRARWPEMKQALKFGLAPKILLLLYAVMLYKATIEISGAAYTLLAVMETIRMPTLAILVVLPLLIGFATGLSLPFVGISFPLLLPFMTSGSEVSSYAILLAYASGAVGYLLSPLHLCLILTTEYFKAPLGMVYRYLLPPLVALGAIIVAVYCIGV